MEQFLDLYGGLPEVIKEIKPLRCSVDLCFIQYLPVYIGDGSDPIDNLPPNLRSMFIESLLYTSINEECERYNIWKYIYITVKHLYGSGNREGWHCDGFGTDDINYIWYDSHPTEFYNGDLLKLLHNHKDSMMEMSETLQDNKEIETYPYNTLIRMDQSSIHRVCPTPFTGLRTFVKVSFSDSKYNLKGNAHNYSLDYSWDMVDRGVDRNHPIGVC